MATFNQQRQKVQHQANGDQVYVGTAAPSTAADIEQLIDELVHRLRTNHAETTAAVIAELEAARAASIRGDQKGVLAFLARAAEIAPPVAAIAASVANIIAGLPTCHE
jgi:hypothetical protein